MSNYIMSDQRQLYAGFKKCVSERLLSEDFYVFFFLAKIDLLNILLFFNG